MNKKELYNKILQLDGLTNEEKSELLGLLRKQKKYGLVWEDKPEDVEERLREELPVLVEDTAKALISTEAYPYRGRQPRSPYRSYLYARG